MAQIPGQELPTQELHRRFRGRRRVLRESMPAPLLIHRPTAGELTVHGGGGYVEALAVLNRALEDNALMAALRRALGWGRAHPVSDVEIVERLARAVAGGRMIICSRAPPAGPSDDGAAAADPDYRALLAGAFGGSAPHMHLDGRGSVMVGVGSSLPTPSAALLARFVHRGGGPAATPAEVSAAYMTVRGAIGGRVASDYRSLTDLDLAPGEADRLLSQDLQRAEHSCRNMFGGWSRFPRPAQLALLDMAYDLGEGRAVTPAERQAGLREQGLYQFGKLREAVAKEDWLAAAAACQREGASQVRNTWTRNQFIEAAHLAPPRPDPHRALRL